MFKLQVGPRTFNHLLDFAAVSSAYIAERDSGLIGAWAHSFRENMMPDGIVMSHDGEQVGRVSYNGRVWPVGGYQPGVAPLYDNTVPA